MTHPQTSAEWFDHLKRQLAGEAEPIVEPDYDDDDDQYPKRRDWV